MTLFVNVSTNDALFLEALTKYFDGNPDQRTLDLLSHDA